MCKKWNFSQYRKAKQFGDDLYQRTHAFLLNNVTGCQENVWLKFEKHFNAINLINVRIALKNNNWLLEYI